MREALEKEIIAGILTDSNKIPEVSQILDVSDFIFYPKLYTALFDLWKAERTKNILLELSHQGFKLPELMDISDAFYSRPIVNACKDLKEISTNESLKKILQNSVKDFPKGDPTEYIAELQQKLIKQSQTSLTENSDAESVIKEFTEYQLAYEEKRKNGQELIGISCGFPKLDALIDGLRKGHVWVIGGYTSLGKTFGALNITSYLIRNKKRVVVYTLEMSRVDILARLLGISTEENSRAIAKGFVDQAKVNHALDEIRTSNLAVISQKRDLAQILLSMHEETLRSSVDLFVVDYLGLISVKGARSEYEQAKEISLELQNAAKRFDTPIIELSQVSNEAAKAGEQMVMGFKGAGDIAAAADLAIELVSGEESTTELKSKMQKGEPVKIKWQVKKNRHGAVGYVMMEFNGKTGVFKELDEDNY